MVVVNIISNYILCVCLSVMLRLRPSIKKWCGLKTDDAEVELLPDDPRLFSGYFWQIVTNPGYFLATVWLILATLG